MLLCFPPLVFFSHCRVRREIIATVHHVYSHIARISYIIQLSIFPSRSQRSNLHPTSQIPFPMHYPQFRPRDHSITSLKEPLPVAMGPPVSLQLNVSESASHRSQSLSLLHRTLMYAYNPYGTLNKLITLYRPASPSLE